MAPAELYLRSFVGDFNSFFGRNELGQKISTNNRTDLAAEWLNTVIFGNVPLGVRFSLRDPRHPLDQLKGEFIDADSWTQRRLTRVAGMLIKPWLDEEVGPLNPEVRTLLLGSLELIGSFRTPKGVTREVARKYDEVFSKSLNPYSEYYQGPIERQMARIRAPRLASNISVVEERVA